MLGGARRERIVRTDQTTFLTSRKVLKVRKNSTRAIEVTLPTLGFKATFHKLTAEIEIEKI